MEIVNALGTIGELIVIAFIIFVIGPAFFKEKKEQRDIKKGEFME